MRIENKQILQKYTGVAKIFIAQYTWKKQEIVGTLCKYSKLTDVLKDCIYMYKVIH